MFQCDEQVMCISYSICMLVAVCFTCDVYKPLCILLQCTVHVMFINLLCIMLQCACCTCDVYKPFVYYVAVCLLYM